MITQFVEGIIYYPAHLPCPQIEIDLVPRERRYLSDIGDVRNLRMFQQEFQATRNRISFVFTEEEARDFREWYDNVIFGGGAWFYADWPTLDKERKIAYRFVGQPEYEWLFGANPGTMGRSVAGAAGNGAVTMYKVHAVVELYYRKVGVYGNVFTSKIYPVHAVDDVRSPVSLYKNLFAKFIDDASSNLSISEVRVQRQGEKKCTFEDDIESPLSISVELIRYIYKDYLLAEDVESPIALVSAEVVARVIPYDRMADDVSSDLSIVGVEYVS